jgi:hypothetical protein
MASIKTGASFFAVKITYRPCRQHLVRILM